MSITLSNKSSKLGKDTFGKNKTRPNRFIQFSSFTMMKKIEAEGASELHFITSKNPNIINLGGELPIHIIIYIEYLFLSRSV